MEGRGRFRLQGSEFRVPGSGFRVQGSAFQLRSNQQDCSISEPESQNSEAGTRNPELFSLLATVRSSRRLRIAHLFHPIVCLLDALKLSLDRSEDVSGQTLFYCVLVCIDCAVFAPLALAQNGVIVLAS